MESESNFYQEGMLENICPASLNDASNFTDTSKHYASELLHLKIPTIEQLSFFEKVATTPLSDQERDVALQITRDIKMLFRFNDHCDGLGASYLLKIGNYFCPNGEHYKNIPSAFQSLLKSELYHSSKSLPVRVMKESGCK